MVLIPPAPLAVIAEPETRAGLVHNNDHRVGNISEAVIGDGLSNAQRREFEQRTPVQAHYAGSTAQLITVIPDTETAFDDAGHPLVVAVSDLAVVDEIGCAAGPQGCFDMLAPKHTEPRGSTGLELACMAPSSLAITARSMSPSTTRSIAAHTVGREDLVENGLAHLRTGEAGEFSQEVAHRAIISLMCAMIRLRSAPGSYQCALVGSSTRHLLHLDPGLGARSDLRLGY